MLLHSMPPDVMSADHADENEMAEKCQSGRLWNDCDWSANA
jgi:hypothetical protein